jgi:hypothetical protein
MTASGCAAAGHGFNRASLYSEPAGQPLEGIESFRCF